MRLQFSVARPRRFLFEAIFLFAATSINGAALAQSMQWPQQPAAHQYSAGQHYQAYSAPAYSAPRGMVASQQFAASTAVPTVNYGPVAVAPAARYAPNTMLPARNSVPALNGQPMPQTYRASVQASPAVAYQQAPPAHSYYVASRANGRGYNPYPVTPTAEVVGQVQPSQPQYAPADQWSDPASQGNIGYGAGNYGSDCCSGTCCEAACCCPPPIRWYGSVGILMLDRDDENHRFYSYDSSNEALQVLDSQETNFDWASGVEAHVGVMDTCSCTGCEAVYWGLYPDTENAYVYPSQLTGNLNGIFNFDQLDYNGQPANNFVDNAAVHRLQRSTELHNVEFNRIWNCGGCGSSCCAMGCDTCCDSCCTTSSCFGGRGGCGGRGGYGAPWTFGVLTGFRYLRFEDGLEFASDPNDTSFTGELDEIYYNIDCDNDLWGWQFGGFGERALGASRVSLTVGAKAGVFLNDADARSTIGGAAGLATINNGPNQGIAWDIESSDDRMAMIGELQAGAAWEFYPTWRLRGDYRVIGISGVALPTNQIYQDLRGIQDVALISTNGDLILHGVFVGVERTY